MTFIKTIRRFMTTDIDPAAGIDESTIVGRHQAFKLRAADTIHRGTAGQDWCETYDSYMMAVGLTGLGAYLLTRWFVA